MPDSFDPIWLRPERSRRGPRPSLSRDEITKAAIELADEEGLGAVSMRRIGAKLGAGATSLYWYVTSKDDLYELMFDALLGMIEIPEKPSGDWRADLRQLAWNTLAVFRAHPWAVQMGIQPGLGPNTQRYARFANGALAIDDMQSPVKANLVATLNNFIFGFGLRAGAWAEARRRSGLSEDEWAARLEDYPARAAGGDEELTQVIAARLELSSDAAFELGLETVLDGIAARIEAV